MARRFFLDARKLGDGGIGTFIKSFVEGLIESNELNRTQIELDLVISEEFQKKIGIPKSWEERKYLNVFLDRTSKYSLEEYLLFPLKWREAIKKCEVYFSPHYTLPYFIPIKRLVVIHDAIQIEYPEKLLHKLIPKFLIKSAISRADFVSTVSEHSREKLSKMFGVNLAIVSVIPNALRLSLSGDIKDKVVESRAEGRKNTIIYVGADRVHKRIPFFIEFVKLLKENKINFKVILVSKLSESSRELIENYKLSDEIEIRDELNDSELLKSYMSADSLVCTSEEEGFCLPLLEAMSKGLSVICPDLGYARELVGDAGYFYNKDSLSDLFLSWTDSMVNRVQREKKREIGLKRSKEFTSLRQFEKFISIIN